jgi:hypothetical protein
MYLTSVLQQPEEAALVQARRPYSSSTPNTLPDMREYLTVCCRNLGDALREVRPIAVNVSVSQIYLRSEEAVAAVGLIVNEPRHQRLQVCFS